MTKENLELINILRNYQPDIDSIDIMMSTPIISYLIYKFYKI